IHYLLGPEHRRVTQATIVYVRDSEEVKGVRYAYEGGAPERLLHRVELPPGRYEIVVELVEAAAPRTLRRTLQVPTEGTVRIDLTERFARLAPTPGAWLLFGGRV